MKILFPSPGEDLVETPSGDSQPQLIMEEPFFSFAIISEAVNDRENFMQPRGTADVFDQFKIGLEEPGPEEADDGQERQGSTVNRFPQDVLFKLVRGALVDLAVNGAQIGRAARDRLLFRDANIFLFRRHNTTAAAQNHQGRAFDLALKRDLSIIAGCWISN
ncbi:MAG TPA: hypothetical protein P5186_03600 [Candidatus Paceibacterota bacterium]|nr:hypothetical protein [Verrucomicrobiota bacterium]HRY47111.1 hypothetical protein [Candidatus Paceibacterota bacterium]HSA02632.1 hypothetical protein [Candidatus Paceibacterota bacterium]